MTPDRPSDRHGITRRSFLADTGMGPAAGSEGASIDISASTHQRINR